MWDNDWIKGEDYPEWGNTDVYKGTISLEVTYFTGVKLPRDAYMARC